MPVDTDPSAAALSSRIRLHRRTWRHEGRGYEVMSLRPGDPTRFSVERWQRVLLIRSDLAGARLLGRLLWDLSYQHRPGALLVLDPHHLAPDPFHGRPSPTVVFGLAPATVLTAATVRALRRPALWRTRPDGTVGWRTASLAEAYAECRARQDARAAGTPVAWPHLPEQPDPVVLDAGSACAVLATAPMLRDWAVAVTGAGSYWHSGESCTEPCYGSGIDVHAVRHYQRLVSAATRARAEVLAAPDRPADPAGLDCRVSRHAVTVAGRRPGPWDDAPSPAAAVAGR